VEIDTYQPVVHQAPEEEEYVPSSYTPHQQEPEYQPEVYTPEAT